MIDDILIITSPRSIDKITQHHIFRYLKDKKVLKKTLKFMTIFDTAIVFHNKNGSDCYLFLTSSLHIKISLNHWNN